MILPSSKVCVPPRLTTLPCHSLLCFLMAPPFLCFPIVIICMNGPPSRVISPKLSRLAVLRRQSTLRPFSIRCCSVSKSIPLLADCARCLFVIFLPSLSFSRQLFPTPGSRFWDYRFIPRPVLSNTPPPFFFLARSFPIHLLLWKLKNVCEQNLSSACGPR